MAIRNIRMIGDDILTKKCKVVKEMTEKNKEVGIVTRPNHVVVKAYNEEMEPFEIEGEELLARALVHEIEHLDGGLYVNKVEGRLYTIEEFEKEFGE